MGLKPQSLGFFGLKRRLLSLSNETVQVPKSKLQEILNEIKEVQKRLAELSK